MYLKNLILNYQLLSRLLSFKKEETEPYLDKVSKLFGRPLDMQNQSYNTVLNTNEGLHSYINFLEDSLSVVILDDKIRQNNLNNAMKFLSLSLTAYYNSEFQLALKETEKAIQVFPDLAIAYARKGTIYYRMGNYKRATINWNIALQLDPEYDEVRSVLLDVKENTAIDIEKLPE